MRTTVIMNVVALLIIAGMAMVSGVAYSQNCVPVDCSTPAGCRWICR